MSVSFIRRLLRQARNVTTFAVPILVLAVADGRAGQPDAAAYTTDELKVVYLNCEKAALSERMDRGGVIFCSTIYEALKQRAFGGDFRKLKDWSEEMMESHVLSDAHRTDAKISFGFSPVA